MTINPLNGSEIAVIGMAERSPGAKNLDAFWRNLRDGVESISFFSDEELTAAGIAPAVYTHPNYVKAASRLEDVDLFDAAFFGFSHREAQLTQPQHRVFLECAWEALENAGYDTDRYDGLVGAFAGTGTNHYWLLALYSNPQLTQAAGELQTMVGSDLDYLTTRVSYKLNLKGPSLTLFTACSTSLVATHLACQSLLNGECDMALAGGISLKLPSQAGYFYQEGDILSPDGHCRAFDEKGRGTIFGSGAGVVVLKRLQEALADGDTIHAVIKGSAVNNDGGTKIGYTAPSVSGQANVIGEALAAAQISAESIGYVETHGTATPLGDPIEIAALTQAFRQHTARKGFCAVGSVKSNVGHLGTAAGITGLIKTILALKHRQLPPSLHFETPNPAIDFANSPFYVNTGLADWPANGTPRRAGVSSFGIGGTNAHVILEEAPPPEPTVSKRALQLLLLSARTETALEAMTAGLADHLKAQPDLPLADAAYTLQVGRRPFNHRRAFLCADREDAIQALETLDPQRTLTRHQKPINRPVAFLFPGGGVQHVQMGRGLYETEPVFRSQLDACSDFVGSRLGDDLRSILYPPAGEEEAASRRLRQPGVALTALFAVEYALAQVWLAWGIRPQAMIGHSLGEYVAACLAGVFSLQEALDLVMVRGQLMERSASGRMLSVPLAEAEAQSLLGEGTWLAAVNGPSLCTLAGTHEAIAEVEARLLAQGLDVRPIPMDAAAHSGLIEPILAEFTQYVGNLKLSPPRLPYVSSVTGTWAAAADVTEPAYWARHLRQTVRFSDGLAEILKDPDTLLLEVGPGQTLNSFAKMQPAYSRERVVLASMRHAREAGPDSNVLMQTLARLWLAGVNVHWDAFHHDERLHRVPLPTYPFERQRYWLDVNFAALQALNPSEVPSGIEAPQAAAPLAPAPASHPRANITTPYVAPRTEVEMQIAAVWQELLGLEQVGLHDNFFELGGHSVLATQLVARVREATRVPISLQSLFAAPTVAGLAEATAGWEGIPETGGDAALALPAIVPAPAERHLPFPLTDLQQAYWVGRSGAFELGNVATHGYLELDTVGLDLERFNLALRLLIDRHEMLRAIVLPDGQQQILERVPGYVVDCLDLSRLAPEARAAQLDSLRTQLSHQVLPSDRWPLFDIRATRLGEDRLRLHVSFDYLMTDAMSLMVLRRELAQLYLQPDVSLPPLALSFRDYVLAEVAFQASDEYRRGLVYWRERLPALPPAPELPLAQAPEALTTPRFVRRHAHLDAETWARLKKRAAQAGLTPSVVLLAAFAEVLAAWSKSPRFTLNLTLFNRLPVHPQVNDILGDFTSLTLVAVDDSIPNTFEGRARALQLQLWANLDHRYVSGVRVLRELAQAQGGNVRAAAMPVVFTSGVGLAGAARPAAGGLTETAELVYSLSQTPQVWLDHQAFENDGELSLNWDAVEALFPPGLLDDMFAAYCGLVGRLTDDEAAWQETQAQRSLVPSAQLERRAGLNATEAPLPTGLLQTGFVEQAARHPMRPAVITPGRTLTYAEVNGLANRVSHWLHQRGARPNALVAVVMEKGWEQVVAVLGILQAGAAYLPVDPALPAERLGYLLHNGEAGLVLTQSWLDRTLAWPEGVQRLCVDDLPDLSDAPLQIARRPEDLAYVIFTSGSTGQPKGVMIDHRAALNTVVDMNTRFQVGPHDRIFALSALNFDLSVYDIFGLLAAGGAVVLPDEDKKHDPAHWASWLAQAEVTLWDSVPALMELLVQYLADHSLRLPPALRLVLLSGDWIPTTLPAQIQTLARQIQVISLGGATEAAIWSILYPVDTVDPEWKSIPYGRPMVNQRFHVLDEWHRPRPVWVPGQLYIGGVGLAQGYWRDGEKTRSKFFNHPQTGERLYHTGDLGRYLPDGTIEFLGREDFQVKIQGYRIELGEIEAALLQHPAVRTAVVVAAPAPAGGAKARRLVAYVVAGSQAADPGDLRSFLKTKLPEYMVPAAIVELDALPLSANGKVDRQALTAVEHLAGPPPAEFVAPRSPIEQVLVDLWSDLLQVPPMGVHDNFFQAGGHSVLAIRVHTWIRETFRVEIPLRRLFETPTVAELTQAIVAAEAQPGQTERIARALLKLKALTPEARQQLLSRKQKDDSPS